MDAPIITVPTNSGAKPKLRTTHPIASASSDAKRTVSVPKRRDRPERTETEDRRHCQHTDLEARKTKVALDVGQEKRHRRYRRPQIEGDQQYRSDSPARVMKQDRPNPPARARSIESLGLVGDCVHRSD
jgi:hypothetical protein